MESSSRMVHTRKTSHHLGTNALREGNEKKKIANNEELSERLIEEVARRIGGARINSPIDQTVETMRGISKSSFASWIAQEVKPKKFSPLILDMFDRMTDPITHFLQFKKRISLEEVSE